ncbi:MAG: hypothetical protein ACI8T1_002031 [Verrucomicrobiales bacterium]|jgi:hypothetical protein
MKERCTKCGKKARMTCPALEAPLCSRCCGTGRGVSIDCTIDCTANPFGKTGYQRFQEMDSALTTKLFKAMAQDGYDYPQMLSESKRFMLIHQDDDPMATGSFAVIQDWVFHQRDANGQTRLQRWEAEGWPGFSNDEQQLLRMRQETQLTLVELLNVEGDHMTRVKDLLDPDGKEHTIFDYSLVRQFTPYQVLFAHVTPLRHFSRIEANTATVDPSHAADLIAFICEKSGATDATAQKSWLRLHAPEVAEENMRLMKAARERIVSSIDLTASTTVYQSDRDPATWADFLEDHAEFEEEPDYDEEDAMEALYGPVHYCFHWQRQAGATNSPRTSAMRMRVRGPGDQVQVLASVYVYQNHVGLSGVDRNLMIWLLDRWSSEIAPGLVVESEGVRDLKTSSKSPEIQATVPSRQSQSPLTLLDDPDDSEVDDEPWEMEDDGVPADAAAIMKDHEEEHFRRLIDDAIPALQGKTPREASKSSDPQLQQIFEQWAKSMIHSQSRKTAQHGYIPDLFWFYRELNLEHLWPSDWPK